jgi:hypothetical protein
MTNRILFMIVEEHANSDEAKAIFKRRGWTPACDQSVPLKGKKQVRSTKHDTKQIELNIEEWEYGAEE